MVYDSNSEEPRRQMYQGNWTCASCGGAITELPFEPDPSRLGSLSCRDCHRKKRGGFSGGDRSSRPRQMHQGNWTCASCGAAITELPFEPDSSRLSALRCRDCHRSQRA